MDASSMGISRRGFIMAAGSGLVTVMAAPLARAAARPDVAVSGTVMGTSWRAIVADAQAGRLVAAVLADIDARMSPFRPGSEITALNAAPRGSAINLSPATRAVVATGLATAERTGGAFNPAVGGLVNRFGFGPIRQTGSIDHRDLALDGRTLTKRAAGVSFDPCGLAKGYALDAAADALRATGARDFLLELGGEVLAAGHHPQGRPWRAGIEDPTAASAPPLARLDLSDRCLATSGDHAQAYQVGDRRYHHIIDPATRMPAASGIVTASVVAPTAMAADALSTALVVMGADAGLAFAHRRGIAALVVARTSTGLTTHMSPAFRTHMRS